MTRWMPEWLQLCMRVFLRVTLFLSVLLFLIAGYYYYKAQQYDITQVAEQHQQNTLLDSDGSPIKIPGAKFQNCITQNDLPQHLVNALIAREDASFQEHCGVDFKGLARATLRNLKDLSFTQGASTLTMQLVKNTYDEKAKSLNRKFLEIALTLRVEHAYSKAEIMAFYLNRIYFGSGCYGIEQAAQKYFGKTTKELNLSESATLVGIIRDPGIFSPLNNPEGARAERNQVLDRMVATEAISVELAEQTKDSPLVLTQKNFEKENTLTSISPYAFKALERHLLEQLDKKQVREAGLTIHTSLNKKRLAQCDSDIQRILASTDDPNLQAACVVLNHQTGGIQAVLGGRAYQSQPFNLALDGSMQLGDAFTPFIYAIALERSKLPIKGKPIQTGKQLDTNDTIAIAKRFGFKGPFDPASIFRGNFSSSPLELATAFATLAHQGKRPHTYYIQKITNHAGSTLFENSSTPTQVIESGSATACFKLLRKHKGVHSYTTFSPKARALWSMASSDTLTAVFWIGYSLPRSVANQYDLIKQMRAATDQWVR